MKIDKEIKRREKKVKFLSKAEIQISQGVLLFLKLSYWSGQTVLKKEDLKGMGIEADKIPDDLVRLGFKYLVPKEEIDKFRSLAGRVRYRVTELSMKYPLAPTEFVRFVPYTLLPELEEKLTTLKREWDEKVLDFLNRYDDYRTRLIEKYPNLREVLEGQVPSVEFINEKFTFSWSYMEAMPLKIKTLKQKRAVMIATRELKILKEHEKKIERMTREYEERLERELRETLIRMKIEYKKEILKTIEDFVNRIEKFVIHEGKVRGPSLDHTLKKIESKVDLLEKFNIFNDYSIANELRKLRSMTEQAAVNYKELPSGMRKIMRHLERSLEKDLEKLPRVVKAEGIGMRKIVIKKEV